MKKAFLLLVFILTINSFAQTTFEKGHIIFNSGQKVECLIKNEDWKNNPSNFEYKMSLNDTPIKANIKDVQEFGIDNTSKYIKSTVKIDRSSETALNLSKDRNPIFKEEQLFLKVLIEGNANLYAYNDVGISRYFFNKKDSTIQQLVYKKYEASKGKIGVNSYYKQQLLKNLQCKDITLKTIENIKYKRTSLSNLFNNYNLCDNSTSNVNYAKNQKKGEFNLSIRPRLNNSSLDFKSSSSTSLSTDFGSKLGFGLGVEFEYILPFNNNKWSIAIEPTYQSFKKEIVTTNNSTPTIFLGSKEVDYSSVEIPISARHYFYINDNSKIFVNLGYVIDIPIKSLTEFRRSSGGVSFRAEDKESQGNLTLGAGYKLHNKFSLELRYQTSREVIDPNRSLQSSNYKTLAFIFGYTLF